MMPSSQHTPDFHPKRAMRAGLAFIGPGLLLALAACGMKRESDGLEDIASTPRYLHDAPTEVIRGESGDVALRVIVDGLEHPWSLAFLPDGDMLVTERPGRLRRISADGSISAPLRGVPTVFVQGQSGLLDVAIPPTHAADGLVYLSYGEPNWRGNKGGTAVARGRLGREGLEDVDVVFRQEPKLSHGTHMGSRIVFDDHGFMFIGTGDNRSAGSAQLLDHHQGKLIRLHPDGSVPLDNPFVRHEGARPEIWSYGHRNIQGMALHPGTGVLWSHEHGPMGGDEINLPRAGLNYGWPLATHGRDYSGGPVPGAMGATAEGTEAPHHYWPVSPAVSGMAFYGGEAFPDWRGNLLVGALAGQALIRLQLDGDRIVHEERLLQGRARIRDVRVGPDGLVYLLTDGSDGQLLRLEPLAPESGPVEQPAAQ